MLQYLISAIIFVILDGTYLNLVKGYFNKQVKSIQGSDIQMNIVATGLVYVIGYSCQILSTVSNNNPSVVVK